MNSRGLSYEDMRIPNQKELQEKLEGKTIKKIHTEDGCYDETLRSIEFEDGTELVLDSSYEIGNTDIYVEVK